MGFRRSLTLAFLIMILVAGCSMRGFVVDRIAGMMTTGLSAYETDNDLALIEASFPANIKLLEAIRANRPDDPAINVLLARLYGSYAFLFMDTRLTLAACNHPGLSLSPPFAASFDAEAVHQQADRYYARGVADARAALAQRYPGFGTGVGTAQDLARIGRMTKDDMPALFWWAFDLGARINLNRGDVRLLAKARLTEVAMNRVAALAPDYNHGGADLFLLAYYGSRPPMMGGKPEAAAMHYRKLMAIAGADYRLGDLYYARYVLQPRQDRKGFAALLETVARNRPDSVRYRLLNAVAAVRARAYLADINDLFEE